MSEWKTGDLVRLKASEADGWRQPFKRFALSGRVGTLRVLPANQQTRYFIRFAPLRKNGRTEDLSTLDSRLFERAPTAPTNQVKP